MSTHSSNIQARAALERVRQNADEYRRLSRMLGAPPYPADNRCGRCAQPSAHPLIPSPRVWLCARCAYPLHESVDE